MKYKDLVGNEAIYKLLANMLVQGKVSHAHLFIGPEGIGKATTAKVFAKSIMCKETEHGEACGECNNCHKFESNNHPDFYSIDGQNGTIKIEHIRELQRNINLRPYESSNRVIVINHADKLTTEAANSLLKILEEPPANNYFVLTSHRPFALLPTVLSRCQQFNFLPVEPYQVEKFLLLQGQNQGEARLLSLLAAGCPGKAAALKETEGLLEVRRELFNMLSKLVRGNLMDEMRIVDYLEKYKDKLDLMIEFIALWLRDILVWKETQSEEQLVNIDFISQIVQQASQSSTQNLVHSLENLFRSQRALAANANHRLVLENMIFQLET